ncbi:hypothetical protein FB561_7337 [Kribbella amoyensis]|uniref:Uncharacterized protein n=1 Tax=Kribbella amoyensis TaxID=996641 RepID=A0A561B3J1_9ACTN|nr:hypothetical protein [Kribbella amoyensis]TWD73446.1 hypothetical protein FB561_7337 [Kribbella amoyensis]
MITPRELSQGHQVADADLPLLAAHWLADGYDSPTLRELAGLTHRDGQEARTLRDTVLAELGHPIKLITSPYEGLPS